MLRCAPEDLKNDPVERCRHTLLRVGKLTTRILCGIDKSTVFRVRTRLYHGWTSGTTRTHNRRAFIELEKNYIPDEIFPSERVLAMNEIEFGDKLIYALPNRELKGSGIHLPNTLRKQSGNSRPTEKMVDTALAADLLCWARDEPTSIALVLSADDDMIPPTFVAESWMVPYGGSIFLVGREQRPESKYLKLEGLEH